MTIQWKLKLINPLLFLIFLIGAITNGLAQYSKEYTTYANKYEDSRKVRLNQKTTITIQLVKGKLEVKQSFEEEDLYLNESASYGSKNSIAYSTFFELEEIKAASYTFEKGKYKKYEVDKFIEKDDLNQSFYDDTKVLSFFYPNLKKGGKSKLYYEQKLKNPRFIAPFYFGDFFPIVKSELKIIADKGVNLAFKKFNISNENIEFTKEEKRKQIIYKWVLKDKDKYEHEFAAPNYKTILPHIVPIITSYTSKGKEKKLLGEVSDLYKWYYSLVKDVNKEQPDEELVKVVETLIKDKKTDLEKVKAIYYWAQKNIKYIAFEYALGGFIPRESNDVFKKKYGDCKDNSSILFKMLEIAKVKGNLTWIGTRSIPYTYNELPTPGVDNHMILSYENNGRTYFLDATGRYIKFGMPTPFIQGKEALVSYGSEFKIKKVPIIEAEKNAKIDSAFVVIDNGKLKGKASATVSGYTKVKYFDKLENINNKDKKIAYYNTVFQKGNNKFLIKRIEEKNAFDYDNNFTVTYDFEIADYLKQLGDEIYVNLNLNKDASYYKTDKKREQSIEYKFKKYKNYYIEFKVPKGYKIDYLPAGIAVKNDLMDCTITYELLGGKILYKQAIKLNFLTLDLEEQKVLNNLIKKIEKNYKEIVVLKKI